MNRAALSLLRQGLVAAAHLAVVALCALRVDLGSSSIVARYASLSGADSAHGYFAPDVAPSPLATFEVKERDGRVLPAPLEPHLSRACEARVQGMVAGSMAEDPASRRAMAATCAGKILGRHPEAESVVVRLSFQDLPSMDEIRRGEHPGESVLYEARFAPRSGRP